MIESPLLRTNAYIGGEWLEAENGKRFEVVNPLDNTVIATVADLSESETKIAIEKAASAFEIWKGYSASKRSRILKNWYQLQMEHARELARILTIEQGKPLGEAIGEIRYGASFVEWFAEEAKRIYGDVIPGHSSDKRITVIKQPIGVVGAITPWNFPSAMITRKVAPALAAGCTVVIKPSELTPLSALALAELAHQAGIPSGVLNVIPTTQASQVGIELCNNPMVKKISFTGSTKVGKLLLRQSADTVKKVTLELGGNAPFIVFEDADIDKAVEGLIQTKFRNAGQTCICSNRVFVHQSILTEFSTKLKEAIATLQIGNGLDKGVHIGPMIEQKAIDKVDALIQDAIDKGAELELGASVSEDHPSIYMPTLLSKVSPDMDIFSNEIFGPVIPLISFDSEHEVIQSANATPYGLAAYFYGRDYARIWRVAEGLEFGMVGINTGMISTTLAPFGGVKESGFGREGSKYGIEEYVSLKYMCWGNVN